MQYLKNNSKQSVLTSVALCTYNGEKFIINQLESILNQIYFINEIIIIDDKSTDSTVLLINELIIQHPGRIKLIQNEVNLGAITSFEKCIKICSGDIIFLSDQDDIWEANKANKQVELLLNDKYSLAVFSDGILIDECNEHLHNTLWNKWGFTTELQTKWNDNNFVFNELLMNRNVITGATLAFKKELLNFLFPFELPLGYWHDAWIGLVAAGLGGLRFLKEPTILYRIHQHQQVGVTAGAGDKKFAHITREYFLQKVASIFPLKSIVIDEPKLEPFKINRISGLKHKLKQIKEYLSNII